MKARFLDDADGGRWDTPTGERPWWLTVAVCTACGLFCAAVWAAVALAVVEAM